MKRKVLISVLVILLILVLTGCGMVNLSGWIYPDDQEFMAMVEELDTPQKIADYMEEDFTYEMHPFYTPDPYILWKTKKGDCNDFSTFAVFVAHYHKYETYQIKLQGKGFNVHWLAVYLENGQYSYSNSTHYYYIQVNKFKYIVMDWYYKNRLNWISYTVYNYETNVVEKGYN